MQDSAGDSPSTHKTPFWSALVLALCTMGLGSGLAYSAGYQFHWSGVAAPLAMGAATVLSFLVAAAISYIARRHVGSGGILSYVQVALPYWAVCIVAGTLLLGYVIGPSANVMWAATYLSGILLQSGIDSAATPGVTSILIVVITAGAGYCAWRGLDLSAKVSVVLGLVCVPIAVAATVLAAATTGFDIQLSVALGDVTMVELARGTFIALSFYVGFDGICALGSETSDPKRNVTRLLAWTLGLVGLTNTVGVLLQTPIMAEHTSALEAGYTPTYVLMSAAGMESLNLIFDVLLYMASLAGIIAWLNISALIVATAAKDGLLPRALAYRHPKTGSPHTAILLLSTLSVILPVALQVAAEQTMLVSMVYLINVLVLYWMVAYGFACAAAIVLHHRERQKPGATYVASAIAIAAIVTILVVQSFNPVDELWFFMNNAGLLLLVIGSAAFYLSTRRRRHELKMEAYG